MPSAEIITIGTELLLGEILDTNAQMIAIGLRESGVDLYRKTTIGDNPQRIAQAIQEALLRSQIIITTGGLGPTVDDPTRQAVALAMGVEVEYRPDLWEQIKSRFQRYNRQPTENNRRQAYLPAGAIAVENPVGTAPAFIFERDDRCVISLPGVPKEMEYLLAHEVLPYIRRHYEISAVILTRTLHTAGAGESSIDDLIGDLETLSNPTVGLAAHSGQVDIRIVAKAGSEEEAKQFIEPLEQDLRQRLAGWIYGVDRDTLESVAMETLHKLGWRLAVVEAGLGGELLKRLSMLSHPAFAHGELLGIVPAPENLIALADNCRQEYQAQVGLAVAIHPAGERTDVYIGIVSPNGQQTFNRPYGGPPESAPRWATHHSLNLIRKLDA